MPDAMTHARVTKKNGLPGSCIAIKEIYEIKSENSQRASTGDLFRGDKREHHHSSEHQGIQHQRNRNARRNGKQVLIFHDKVKRHQAADVVCGRKIAHEGFLEWGVAEAQLEVVTWGGRHDENVMDKR